MIKRSIIKEFTTLISEYPVMTILGPRQAGKTTLAKTELDEYAYSNLEIPEVRQYADFNASILLLSTNQTV